MIQTKNDLKQFLKYEKELYKNTFLDDLTSDQRGYIWKYVKRLRKSEYHYNNRKGSLYHKTMYVFYKRIKNKLGVKIGIEIWENVFDIGLLIHHCGSIVVNGSCRVGKNCQLHGNNCLGNAGYGTGCPCIGDNVDIGVGAKIIGEIILGNDLKIGANAVVNKSFKKSGITLVGIPAREVIKTNENTHIEK